MSPYLIFLSFLSVSLSSSGVNTISGSFPKSHSSQFSDLSVTHTPLSVDQSPDSGVVTTPVSIHTLTHYTLLLIHYRSSPPTNSVFLSPTPNPSLPCLYLSSYNPSLFISPYSSSFHYPMPPSLPPSQLYIQLNLILSVASTPLLNLLSSTLPQSDSHPLLLSYFFF